MDKYKQQQQHESDFRRGRPVDEGRRRTKLRKENEITESNNDNSNGTKSNYASSSLRKQPQPHGGIGGGGSRIRSLRTGFDPQTNETLYKTSARSPSLAPRRPVNEKKAVNWRLACFMSNEYLTRGTLLGRPWLPQDSNPKCHHENNYKSKLKSASLEKNDDEIRQEKEKLYHTFADFLRGDDVYLPGIVNPSQLASWLGLNA